jgi:hypothetical protein
VSELNASDFPAQHVRLRARGGPAAAFPDVAEYGRSLFGASDLRWDLLDSARLVPPVFMPGRLDKLIDLGREPLYTDVELDCDVGGFNAPMPIYISAFGSTTAAAGTGGVAASRQAGQLGLPLVIGENIVPTSGYRERSSSGGALTERLRAYCADLPDELGGVVVQQSTEDAEAEVWNLVYSDPSAQNLLDTGRLGFELKVGQGAKPGLGGMTLTSQAASGGFAADYALDGGLFPGRPELLLRSSSPGTLTQDILRHQIRLMRNNYPRARIWVKLPPGRDIGVAAATAWASGAHAVTIDGAEGGTGWAPLSFLNQVGLPLGECLIRVGPPAGCLLVTGRMWEGTRAVKALALGARAVGLGRAALLAVDEDPRNGLIRLIDCLAMELRLLISALGQYRSIDLTGDDVWFPGHDTPCLSADSAGQDGVASWR